MTKFRQIEEGSESKSLKSFNTYEDNTSLRRVQYKMTTLKSAASIVARFLKSNNHLEILDAFLHESGLPLDAGTAGRADLTIENILEEKLRFDMNVGFEKLGVYGITTGWSQPGMIRELYSFSYACPTT